MIEFEPRPVLKFADEFYIERFLSRIRLEGECWVWTGSLSAKGYGTFRLNHKTQRAHRVSFLWATGAIPEGLQLDHLCRVRACVNPSHLEPVTSRENTMRGTSIVAALAKATHCVRGHEFTPENTWLYGRSTGNSMRRCRECYETVRKPAMRERSRRIQAATPPKPPIPPKTHCKYGHEFTPENTYIYTFKNGNRMRVCRTCKTAYQSTYGRATYSYEK